MSISSIESCPSANGQSSVTNPLQLTGFELRIARIPNLSFFIKDVTLPSISLGETTQATPFMDIPRVGEKLTFSQLTCRLMVDEKLNNYRALYDWITGIGNPVSFNQISKWRTSQGDTSPPKSTDSDLLLVSDATLAIKGQNLETAALIKIKDMWISELGTLSLTDESQETQYLYCDCSFACRGFYFYDSENA